MPTPALASPHAHLFDHVTGDLLLESRNAYVRGQLGPEPAHAVETFLEGSPIQANIVLGYARELAARAQQQGHGFVQTPWVAQRLTFQAMARTAGPLRRPAVRAALGLLLALSLASVVQWLRNEPLVPAPVVAAVVRASAAATRATRHLVERFAKAAPARPPHAAAAPAVPERPRRTRAVTPLIPTRPAVATLSTDSSAGALPTTLRTAPAGTVRGRIIDASGRPLPGATVWVRGTHRAVSANAAGDYVLEVPTAAALTFGYGGCADQTFANPGTGTLDVTLRPAGGR